jgi:hypothetical protein
MTEPVGGHASGNDYFSNNPMGDGCGGAPIDGSCPSDSAIESFIRAAGDFIEPTDDLRPRTLERARRRCQQQRIERRAGGMAVAALLLAMSLPSRIDHSGRFESAYELHRHTFQQAIEGKPSEAGTDASWGLVDTFTEWRRHQAELFSGWHNNPLRDIPPSTGDLPSE